MKIQPIDFNLAEEPPTLAKPVFRSRFKRLFERPFSSVLRIPPPAPDKPIGTCNCIKDGLDEFEPSSTCLARMVQNFIEESPEKPQQRCNRKRCNCFSRNLTDNLDNDPDASNSSPSDACDRVKSLVPCLCVSEWNLLADTAKIIDRNKVSKHKDESSRKLVTDGLISLGYNASICRSKWEKCSSVPSGEYEYIDVIIEAERYILDIEFRSQFEVARATKAYRAILQTLPSIFVGQSDRLEKIITIVSEAARQSLNKKGMPFPPWRNADYVKAKWLSPFTRINKMMYKPLSPASANPIPTGFMLGKGLMKFSVLEKGDSAGEGVFVLSISESESSCEGDGIIGVKGMKKAIEIRGKGWRETRE